MAKEKNKFAIIATGGKQYSVREGDIIDVELLDAEPGQQVKFSEVLLLGADGEATVGTPAVRGAVVTGKVVDHVKGGKQLVFKKKRRKGYRRLRGHRQNLTQVTIESISVGPAAPAEAPEKETKAEPESAAKKKAPEAKPATKAEPKAAAKKAEVKAPAKKTAAKASTKSVAKKTAAKKAEPKAGAKKSAKTAAAKKPAAKKPAARKSAKKEKEK